MGYEFTLQLGHTTALSSATPTSQNLKWVGGRVEFIPRKTIFPKKNFKKNFQNNHKKNLHIRNFYLTFDIRGNIKGSSLGEELTFKPR